MDGRPAGSVGRWRQRAARFRHGRVFLAMFAAGVLVLALATNAFASIPDQSNVYHACVQAGNLPIPGQGTMRLIDTEKGQSCTRHETPVSWNANGVAGPTGATGATGPQGPAGATGPSGASGPVGPVGPAGVDGATGATGPAGPAGVDGASGPIGPTGPVGLTGADGATGPSGPSGATGPIGPSGTDGAAGGTGATGPAGPAGSGLGAFGYVYELPTLIDATVLGGADVPFSNNGPLSGVTHTAGTTTITVPTAGQYRVSWYVNITFGGLGSSFAVAVNGTVDASTNVNSIAPGGEVSGNSILSLAAGDVLTLRNNSALPATLGLAPGVGSGLTIEKIDATAP